MTSSGGGAVLYDQAQCFGVDVEQISVDVYILRCSLRLPQKSCVAFEGGFIVRNRDVGSVVECRDIDALFVMKGLVPGAFTGPNR